MDNKQKAAELAKKLRDELYRQDPIMRSVVDLLKVLQEAAKESLVGADGNDMLRLQGEARAFGKLIRELTNQPPNIKPLETQ